MEIKPLKIGELEAEIPVIQGGMGVGISLSNLAGAVAAAGGIGVISAAQIGFRDKAFAGNPLETNLRVLAEEITKAKEKAKGGIIGVNIMVATRNYEEYVKAAVKAGVDLIISGAGLPTKLPELVQNAKTKIAPIVSSMKAAKVICRLWDRSCGKAPDLIVIEGPRAGGHLGFSAEDLPGLDEQTYDKEIIQILDYVKDYSQKKERKIPVVVAGGIYERNDMLKYLEFGADGVQVGTRFVTTHECDADEAYKQAYIKARKEDIKIVKSPVGMPGRAINNPFIKKTENEKTEITKCYGCLTGCNPKEIPYCISTALMNAARGKTDEGLIFCGANAWRAEKLESVQEIMGEFSQK